ncbi:unnamed protein product [Symbiodinium natans]|uniref:Uncharacterized protein n=1 Tax=Symbiodinium natans TaxID=878477 RepID=A0A812V5H8_9DINO|nr:unnamed protein product [Symbiodinium natans]
MLPPRSATSPGDSSSARAQGATLRAEAEVAPRSSTETFEKPLKGKMDILVAGGPDYQRFIFMAHAQRYGVEDAVEVTDRRDFEIALLNSQKYSQDQPFVVFLGDESWLQVLKKHDFSERPLYLVNVNVTSSNPDAYHRHVFSSVEPKEVESLLLEVLHTWWPAACGDRDRKSLSGVAGATAGYHQGAAP